jgi:signal recognition particle GTPase
MLLKRLPVRFLRGFKEKYQEKELKKQQEAFRKMIEELSRKEEYTLRDFRKDIISQDSKGRSSIRKLFSEAQPEDIQLENQKKIVNAFKDEELIGNKPITREIKQEIAQVTQTTIQDVNDLMSTFKIQFKLHGYLKSRRERGDYIPQSKEELINMMRTDRPPHTKEEKYESKRKFSDLQKKWLPSIK